METNALPNPKLSAQKQPEALKERTPCQDLAFFPGSINLHTVWEMPGVISAGCSSAIF